MLQLVAIAEGVWPFVTGLLIILVIIGEVLGRANQRG